MRGERKNKKKKLSLIPGTVPGVVAVYIIPYVVQYHGHGNTHNWIKNRRLLYLPGLYR